MQTELAAKVVKFGGQSFILVNVMADLDELCEKVE